MKCPKLSRGVLIVYESVLTILGCPDVLWGVLIVLFAPLSAAGQI